MAIAAMSGFHALSQQSAQLLSHHKRGGHSLTDVDAASPSVALAPSKTGNIDISA